MGKQIAGSQASFGELKICTDSFYAGNSSKSEVFKETYKIIDRYGIKLRQDDGKNPKMTISVPKAGNSLVVGIRYKKNDDRYTEDHFVFRPNANLYKCKGKELDKLFPEYKGSHTLQME